MKTFQQFNEDVEQLRKDLETLKRHTAPELQLSANRKPLRQAKSNERT